METHTAPATERMNLLGNAKFPALTFGERFISDFFRAFVNTLPCSYPGCRNEPSDAHHPVHKSAGNSAGDEITIPLCRIHHSKWISVEKFEAETGLKMGDVIRSVWQRFIRFVEVTFTGEPKASPRAKKVAQKKAVRSDFKESKFNPRMEYCRHCKRVTAKSEKENKHTEECITLQK